LPGELRSSDVVAVRDQIGREPTTPFTVVARCSVEGAPAIGHPLVIRNAPRDAHGDPFPTTFWLTCPDAVKAVSRLEADGSIARLNEDASIAAAIERSHEEYAAERARDLSVARAWGGVGGTRRGVKCLHAHYAWRLAGGDDPVGAWVAERVEPVHEGERVDRVAAIDQGTNSIRLLVVEQRDGRVVELARDMIITRLGQGVGRTGRLERDALARTEEVLASYARRVRALGAERIRVAGTAALRDASNGEEFSKAVRELTGSDLEVITGEHEAELSFLGATHGLLAEIAPPPYAVVDVGGGSTEIVTADQAGSMQMGSVRMTESFVRTDPPSPDDVRAMEAAVDAILESSAVPAIGDEHSLVAVAGTATTIQGIALGLDRYDPERTHRTWLTRAAAEDVLQTLVRMTNEERAAIPVMPPGRGDVIVAGAVILLAVMRRLRFERALVSETDILDGLIFELLGIR